MRRQLFAIVVLLLWPSPHRAQDWTALAPKVAQSVFRLESADRDGRRGTCSAVLINADRAILLTAAHCFSSGSDGRSITVSDRHASVERWNELLDLAIVRVPGLKGTPMAIRTEPIQIGTPIALVGFGFGAARHKFSFGFISDVEDASLAVGSTFFDAVAISGQSGGVIVDDQGALVSIVQAAMVARVGSLAIGPTPKRVTAFAADYLPPP